MNHRISIADVADRLGWEVFPQGDGRYTMRERDGGAQVGYGRFSELLRLCQAEAFDRGIDVAEAKAETPVGQAAKRIILGSYFEFLPADKIETLRSLATCAV